MGFLVEKSPLEGGTLQIEDITAEIMPGVDRALATARRMLVAGTALHGAGLQILGDTPLTFEQPNRQSR